MSACGRCGATGMIGDLCRCPTSSTVDAALESKREQVQLASKVWEEFSTQLARNLPDLGDILVLAATKVARDHFNPKNRNMEFAKGMDITTTDEFITIRIRK